MTILEIQALNKEAAVKKEAIKKEKKMNRSERRAAISKHNTTERTYDEDGVETWESANTDHAGIRTVTPEQFSEVTRLWMADSTATKPEFELGKQPWIFKDVIKKGQTEKVPAVVIDATFWNQHLAKYFSRDIMKKMSDYTLDQMKVIITDSQSDEFTVLIKAMKPAVKAMIANRAKNSGFGLYLEPHEVSSITTNTFDEMMKYNCNMYDFGTDEDGAIFKCVGMYVAKAFSNYVAPYRNDGKALDREKDVNCLFNDPNVGGEWVRSGDHNVSRALARFLFEKFGSWEIYEENVVATYKGQKGAYAAELRNVYKQHIFDESGLTGATIYEIKDAVAMFKEGDPTAWRDVEVSDGEEAIDGRSHTGFSKTMLATMNASDEVKAPQKAKALREDAGMEVM